MEERRRRREEERSRRRGEGEEKERGGGESKCQLSIDRDFTSNPISSVDIKKINGSKLNM